MDFIYQYPEARGADVDMLAPGPIPEVARVADQSGWRGFSLTEHPVPGRRWLAGGGHQSLDPFVALAAAAATTERLKLLTYLAVAAYRNPFLLAKSAATVDIISSGRFVLGLGAGYHKTEFHALGVTFEERGALLDEALDVLPLHWSGEPFSYTGRHFDAQEVMARPTPVSQPIPIWLGGNAEVTLRRVAERAQGWMPLVGSPELFRTTKAPPLSGPEDVIAGIAKIKAMAGERAAALSFVATLGGVDSADPSRNRDQNLERLAALAEGGVTHVVLSGTTTSPAETYRFLERFGAVYINT